jgi:hypothetical protein
MTEHRLAILRRPRKGRGSNPLTAAAIACVLTGCSRARTDVAIFSELPAAPTGQTFIVLPVKAQERNADFQAYAGAVGSRLQAKGYHAAPDVHQADYVVFLSYAAGTALPAAVMLPDYTEINSGYGAGGEAAGGSAGPSSTGETSSASTAAAPAGRAEIKSGNLQDSYSLVMDMVDLHKSRPGHVHTAFEGRVVAAGSGRDLAAVSGCLADALFESFPGYSGMTRSVELDLHSCPK